MGISAFRRSGRSFLSFFARLVRSRQPGNSISERRDISGKFLKAISTGSPLNGDISDSSNLQKVMAALKTASERSPEELIEALRALARASDSRDPYTRGHSERVTRFSVEIARTMEFSEQEVERVRIGALAHDIGKLTIDGKILNKPTLLTKSEYALMKTHTTRGSELLKHIPFLKDILPGIQCHHEQLDGNGYPLGLRGGEIPMIARIITVADCFDAMTTARPYQDPASTEHALEKICAGVGIKFDNRVVEALVRGVRTGRIMTRAEDRTRPVN